MSVNHPEKLGITGSKNDPLVSSFDLKIETKSKIIIQVKNQIEMVTVTENRIFDNRKISKTDNAIDDLGFDSSLFYNQFSSSSILMQGFTKVF